MDKAFRRLTMEDLISGNLDGITMEDVHYNGFSGQYRDTDPTPGQLRVACVGDSITYGHGIFNWPENNYPSVLGRLLGEGYHVRNFGVCGRCVQDDTDQPYRQTERYRQSLAYGADILIFMMGTNDSKPENWHGVPAFRAALRALLEDYLTGEKPPALYLCIPATAFFAEGYTGTVTRFDVQPEVVDTICRIVREAAQELGCPTIDIHALTGANPQWFSADSVHPDSHGAAAIAQEIHSVFANQAK